MWQICIFCKYKKKGVLSKHWARNSRTGSRCTEQAVGTNKISIVQKVLPQYSTILGFGVTAYSSVQFPGILRSPWDREATGVDYSYGQRARRELRLPKWPTAHECGTKRSELQYYFAFNLRKPNRIFNVIFFLFVFRYNIASRNRFHIESVTRTPRYTYTYSH